MSTEAAWDLTPTYDDDPGAGPDGELEDGDDLEAASSGGELADEDVPRLYFSCLSDFVEQVVVQLYRRHVGRTGQFKWSAQWWRNPEAVTRLEAMWRSWEHLRLDPATGTSTWLLAHGDPHMRVLLSKDGPFALSEDANRPGEALPFEPAPAVLARMHAAAAGIG